MKIKISDYLAKPNHKVNLKKSKTQVKALYKNDKSALETLESSQEEIRDFQERLYAQKDWAVLIVLQGMDTAGKDGLIEHVLKKVNPQGCSVTSFKKPTGPELVHDFLWRTHTPLPRKGEIGVFNRSYYEDMIVPYVHPEILDESRLPKKILQSKDLLKNRGKDIVNFEKYLLNQGILVVKFFLHLSKDEQKRRLISRIDDSNKNWKFEDADIQERKFWDKYQKAYEFCLSHTSHNGAPWHIIPSDDKLASRLIASRILTESLGNLKLAYPVVGEKRKGLLKKFRAQLQRS